MMYLGEFVDDFPFRPAGDEDPYSNIPNVFHPIKEIEEGWNIRILVPLGPAFIETINHQNQYRGFELSALKFL
jgi:hypothetical protein